jgi:hypothetical protein
VYDRFTSQVLDNEVTCARDIIWKKCFLRFHVKFFSANSLILN